MPPPVTFETELRQALVQRERERLYRRRPLVESPSAVIVQLEGQKLLSFCSNDYLGLANHPDVVAAFQAAAKDYGVGSGASHLVSGHSVWHHRLEQALADYCGRERVLLFSTGYMANLGIISALLGKRDAIFEDKLNHASLIDAGLSCGAKFSRYQHNNSASLAAKLQASQAHRKLIVTDSVFSMDGDIAPLPELIGLAREHDAVLMIDDAHGFGVLNGGRGYSTLSQAELPIYMATLGKGLGCFGAFVAGSEALIETLIQFARSYIYTTALPPAVAAASFAALQVMQREAWRQQHLAALISQFKRGVSALGLALMPSDTAIQPIVLGDSATALALSAGLRERGFWVTAIRPPTVPVGSARLRITLSAAHSPAQVDSLINALGELCQ